MKLIFLLLFSVISLGACNSKPSGNEQKNDQAETDTIMKTGEEVMELLNNDAAFSSEFLFDSYPCEVGNAIDATKGFFIIIKSHDKEYPSKGIAFFENISDPNLSYNNIKRDYKLKFANLNALMCEGCNNSTSQDIAITGENDSYYQLVLSISWGPSINRQFDQHKFVFDKKSNKWMLNSISASWLNGERLVDTNDHKLYIDTYNIEEDGFNKSIFKPEFDSNQWKEVAEILKDVLNNPNEDERNTPLIMSDIIHMVTNINTSNVQAANDCAYYLEQLYEDKMAEMILETILDKFPNRTVAYLNLGDVYKNQEKTEEAKTVYKQYIKLMQEQGMENKIPDHVFNFIE